MAEHDPQLLKGILAPLLIALLAEHESYGYELVQRLHELGLASIAEGTVYPALTRLEREGRLGSRLVPSSAGPARKYYHPTPLGISALAESTESWRALSLVVDRVLSRPRPDVCCRPPR